MAPDDHAVHIELLAQCAAAGIRLIFDACLSPEDPGDGADSYRPALYGSPPQISVWRQDPRQPDDVVAETITLAHEFGHHQTQVANLVSEPHRVARRKGDEDEFEDGPQTENDIELVLAEEELAWALARSTLALIGFSRWDQFEQKRADCLASYSFKVLASSSRP